MAGSGRAPVTKAWANIYNAKIISKMAKENDKKDLQQSLRQGTPRLLGDIFEEMLQSNSPLGLSYRKFLADKVNAEKGEGEK